MIFGTHMPIRFPIRNALKKETLYLRRVFQNRELRRIFGPKRDEVTAGWRKLHKEELHYLYSSPSMIRMIKSERMKWAGHVTRMWRRGMPVGYWWEGQKERYTRKTKT
jgi:hypothetical protein